MASFLFSVSSQSRLSLHVGFTLIMAAFRPTTASRRVKTLIPTRRNVHSLQCAGITRRGARCSRRITASNLPGRSGKTNTASYCKIHLRINLNATSSSNLPRAAKKGPFKGTLSNSLRILGFSYPLAHVPPYVGAHACKSICDALSKGPSPADEPGAIYAFEVHGEYRYTHISRVYSYHQTRLGPILSVSRSAGRTTSSGGIRSTGAAARRCNRLSWATTPLTGRVSATWPQVV